MLALRRDHERNRSRDWRAVTVCRVLSMLISETGRSQRVNPWVETVNFSNTLLMTMEFTPSTHAVTPLI
jgi:hypothetical protein